MESKYRPSGSWAVCGGDLSITSSDFKALNWIRRAQVRKSANLQKAFNVELKEYKHPNGNYRGRTGSISIPAEYADIIQGVFGLDDRPQAEPHFRRMEPSLGLKSHTASISHDPNEVGKLYDFPVGD